MTFEEALEIARTHHDICYDDYYECFYYGGRCWLEWPEKTQNNIENPNVIGSMVNWDSCARRPYYRMRGKPVTKEQAAEIKRQSDFRSEESNLMNFFDWCREDGFIGGDGMTQKWPTSFEFLWDMFIIASEFDYLDLFIAITDMNEINFRYNYDIYDEKEGDYVRDYDYYGGIDGWYDWISLGILVKDGHFEVYDNKEQIKKLYNEYRDKYEIKGVREGDPDNPYDVWRDKGWNN